MDLFSVTLTPTPIAWHPDQTFWTAVTAQTNIVRQLGDPLIWFEVVLLPYLLFGLPALVIVGQF